MRPRLKLTRNTAWGATQEKQKLLEIAPKKVEWIKKYNLASHLSDSVATNFINYMKREVAPKLPKQTTLRKINSNRTFIGDEQAGIKYVSHTQSVFFTVYEDFKETHYVFIGDKAIPIRGY